MRRLSSASAKVFEPLILKRSVLEDATTTASEIMDCRRLSKSYNVLLTCEHAQGALPRPYAWSEKDSWVRNTHYAFDIGSAVLTREMAQRLGCVAVLGRFSRLLVDLNRPLASETLFRQEADGKTLEINSNMSRADRDWRLWRYYLPYHMALGEVAARVDPGLVLSMHTFNPEYEGNTRSFELGVLCTTEDELARQIAQRLNESGFSVQINQPWSGRDGFMFAADCVKIASRPGTRKSIMLEVRNDLALNTAWRSRAIECVASAIPDTYLAAHASERPAA